MLRCLLGYETRGATETVPSTSVVPPDIRLVTDQAAGGAARLPVRPAPGSDAECEMLMRELRRFDCNISRTARALNVSRVTLYRMLRRNGLQLRPELVLPSTVGADMAGGALDT